MKQNHSENLGFPIGENSFCIPPILDMLLFLLLSQNEFARARRMQTDPGYLWHCTAVHSDWGMRDVFGNQKARRSEIFESNLE